MSNGGLLSRLALGVGMLFDDAKNFFVRKIRAEYSDRPVVHKSSPVVPRRGLPGNKLRRKAAEHRLGINTGRGY